MSELSEALDQLPEVKKRLETGQQFNVYERSLGGWYVALGPITNRPLVLAVADDEEAAEFLVQALRALTPPPHREGRD